MYSATSAVSAFTLRGAVYLGLSIRTEFHNYGQIFGHRGTGARGSLTAAPKKACEFAHRLLAKKTRSWTFVVEEGTNTDSTRRRAAAGQGGQLVNER